MMGMRCFFFSRAFRLPALRVIIFFFFFLLFFFSRSFLFFEGCFDDEVPIVCVRV
jgi:hypothetical protein